jgi:hypothetical protein
MRFIHYADDPANPKRKEIQPLGGPAQWRRRMNSMITKADVANRIAAYLHHRTTLDQLVDWAENALMEGELDENDAQVLSAVIARLGVADVRAFGLTWDDCEQLLRQLGFAAQVQITAS